jgi:carboxyl-terminal processing protease
MKNHRYWRLFAALLNLPLALFFAMSLPFAGSSYGQTNSSRSARLGDDPFEISRGKSFNASRAASNPKSAPNKAKSPVEAISSDFQEAIELIQKNYFDTNKTKNEDLTSAAIDSMLKTLDPHSNYFTPEQFTELINQENSEYFGTGITITDYKKDGKLETYILATAAGSPAARAGLRFGDKIIAVNDQITAGLDSAQIRELIRGPKNTKVSLTIERNGQAHKFLILRDRIPQKTVNASFKIGNTGFIKLDEGFSFTTPIEFSYALEQLKQSKIDSLIIDLRGNPGGILDSAIAIAEKFLPSGTLIVSQKGRRADENLVWKSKNARPENLPLVLLVNNETASAAEVLAAALQDNDRAVVVGENTFGKGLVQSVIDLPAQAGLTLTTARYLTPSGRSLQRDYSSGSLYDYFFQRASLNSETASEKKYSVSGRPLLAGNGITPDIQSAGEKITPLRVNLLDPLFFFARDTLAGKTKITPEAVLLGTADDESIFKSLIDNSYVKLGESLQQSDKDWIISRIRYNIILGLNGSAAAEEMILRNDRQVDDAVKAFSRLKEILTGTKTKQPVVAAKN